MVGGGEVQLQQATENGFPTNLHKRGAGPTKAREACLGTARSFCDRGKGVPGEGGMAWVGMTRQALLRTRGRGGCEVEA